MPTLDATVGGADANSYATRAEADTYFDNGLNAATWSAFPDDTKDRALIEATRTLDLMSFHGRAATTTQGLAFPRVLAPNYDGTSLPKAVTQATFELALVLAQAQVNPSEGSIISAEKRAQLQSQNVTSVRLGDYSETYGKSSKAASSQSVLASLPVYAQRLIGPWVRTTRQIVGPRDSVGSSRWWPPELRC